METGIWIMGCGRIMKNKDRWQGSVICTRIFAICYFLLFLENHCLFCIPDTLENEMWETYKMWETYNEGRGFFSGEKTILHWKSETIELRATCYCYYE